MSEIVNGIAYSQYIDYECDHGVMVSNEGGFFWGLAGQILHGSLSIVCFGLVGVAFWRFGWKIGVIDLVLILIAGNVGLSFCGRLRKK